MILTLSWKEYREHRSIWITMVFMTGLLIFAISQLAVSRDQASVLALTALGLAGTYGVVCGSMMFAGEKEGSTLIFLDIFLGRRGLLWFWKALIGVFLVLSEGIAVGLFLFFWKQRPADWVPALMGLGREAVTFMPAMAPVDLTPHFWLLVLPALTLEAFAWGLLGSALTQRVLTGATLAAMMSTPFWLITVCAPPQVSFGIRLVGAVIALLFSYSIFLSQSPETSQGSTIKPKDRPQFSPDLLDEWDNTFDLPRRKSEARKLETADHRPLFVPEPAKKRKTPRSWVRPTQAESPGMALWWLTFRQSGQPLLVLGIVGLLAGLFLFSGQLVWPLVTLLLGVICGTATFGPEQRDLTYQFLASQHLPWKKIWNVKLSFWLIVLVLTPTLLLIGSGLAWFLLKTITLLSRNPVGQDLPRFHIGTLGGIMGWINFLGIWLFYGFCTGQVLVWYCRKNIMAILLAYLVSLGAIGLWFPSMLCLGMNGWQLWLPPLGLLITGRFLLRSWAGGDILERRPLAIMIGYGLLTLAWVGLNMGYRAWEIPDVGEPMDRAEFRETVPTGKANAGGQKIQEAIADFDQLKGKKGPWMGMMAEAVRLPLGIIVNPPEGGQMPLLRHLPMAVDLTNELCDLSKESRGTGNPEKAIDYLAQALVLSRCLRNKAPLESYLTGVKVEEIALVELNSWLAQDPPTLRQLQIIMKVLNHHAEETPSALGCLQTECYRSGGALENPTTWTFYSGERESRIRERWLAGTITMSLDTFWEKERATRLWQVVWAGMFRTLQSQGKIKEFSRGKATTRMILLNWTPAREGPDAFLTPGLMSGLLDASWLSDERLFTSVVRLRGAATRARWQLESTRLATALGLYHLQEGKTAKKLENLVPKYLPKLPVDPYSGENFHYRISSGERLQIIGVDFQNRPEIQPGQGILWSTGPDRIDNDGRLDGSTYADDDPHWESGGLDLIRVIPGWQKKS